MTAEETKATEDPTREIAQRLNVLDRLTHAWLGHLTMGVSPTSLELAYRDWSLHLERYPGKQLELWIKALRKMQRLTRYAGRCALDPCTPPCLESLEQDDRFEAPEWRYPPFNLIHQSFLLTQQWWHNATTGVTGVTPHHEKVVNFMSRQWLDIGSPSNYLFTNPGALQCTMQEGGHNLWRGWQHFLEDVYRYWADLPPAGSEAYRVGENLAVTPGKVVFRNRLIELIQYEPTTKTVHPEPILIVPAWIMKYYILDLRPGRSLVEYLLDRGHTVFMISWKNPGPEERELGMEDYRQLGVMHALDAVNAIVPGRPIHAAGYCLGGTLLSLAAAAMAREGDDRLKSLTLLATQVDFTEPGELELFIDESQVAFLEHVMWLRGYLDSQQVAGAFAMLRSRDLIWSRIIHEYLFGQRQSMFDLKAWNADPTHLPYRMHSDYLRKLFLDNEFASEQYEVDGKPIHFGDIRVPIFVVATVKDHIAPWYSVYKINRLARTEVTFLLTSGGHNAGVVTPPGHPNRLYQVATRQPLDEFMGIRQFRDETPYKDGSWWPEWSRWLRQRSGSRGRPPAMGAAKKGYVPICDAPGEYVLQT